MKCITRRENLGIILLIKHQSREVKLLYERRYNETYDEAGTGMLYEFKCDEGYFFQA